VTDGLFGQLRGELLGREGRAWAGSVEGLLFEGESLRRAVSMGDNRVVVTSHRLLAFTPTADGETYRQVDLPNVGDVRAGHDGEDSRVARALRMFVYGAILLAVGVFFDFGSIVPTDAFGSVGEGAGQLDIGGLLGMMRTMLELIAMIDDLALAFGALFLLFGAFVVVYLFIRDRVLVVSVAGDDPDITVPPGDDADDGGRSADAGFKTDDPL